MRKKCFMQKGLPLPKKKYNIKSKEVKIFLFFLLFKSKLKQKTRRAFMNQNNDNRIRRKVT